MDFNNIDLVLQDENDDFHYIYLMVSEISKAEFKNNVCNVV